MPKIYVISDTHLDGKMGQLVNGPYLYWRYDDSNYTQKVIDNWHATVKPEDTVIHVGDVIGNDRYTNAMGKIIRELPGYKILVRGNHDSGQISKWQSCFQEVVDTYVHENVVFCHYPVNPIEYGAEYSVYGHVHYQPKTKSDSHLRHASAYFSFAKNFCFVLPEWNYGLPELSVFLEKRAAAGAIQEQLCNNK